MNDIRFETSGPGRGELYINGHKISGVLAIEPDLFNRGEIGTVTITLAVRSLTVEPKLEK